MAKRKKNKAVKQPDSQLNPQALQAKLLSRQKSQKSSMNTSMTNPFASSEHINKKRYTSAGDQETRTVKEIDSEINEDKISDIDVRYENVYLRAISDIKDCRDKQNDKISSITNRVWLILLVTIIPAILAAYFLLITGIDSKLQHYFENEIRPEFTKIYKKIEEISVK